jgi:hypothetical protein
MSDNLILTPTVTDYNTTTPRVKLSADSPDSQPNNRIRTELLNRVSLDTSASIAALIDFRSALHRWAANPNVSAAEFQAEIEKATEAGLLPFVNYLVCNLGNFQKVVIGGER